MELFDKKFVHFLWDDSLEDKEGFFADDVIDLQARVNENNTIFYAKACKAESVFYPIAVVDMHDTEYRFFYYDPNYKVKLAYTQGKKLQCRSKKTNEQWRDCDKPNWWEDLFEYRIKSEEEIKTRRMTYRELAEWLAKGNGQWCKPDVFITTSVSVDWDKDNAEVHIDYKIRRWGSDEWIEPTVDVYEADCKEKDVKEEVNEG